MLGGASVLVWQDSSIAATLVSETLHGTAWLLSASTLQAGRFALLCGPVPQKNSQIEGGSSPARAVVVVPSCTGRPSQGVVKLHSALIAAATAGSTSGGSTLSANAVQTNRATVKNVHIDSGRFYASIDGS